MPRIRANLDTTMVSSSCNVQFPHMVDMLINPRADQEPKSWLGPAFTSRRCQDCGKEKKYWSTLNSIVIFPKFCPYWLFSFIETLSVAENARMLSQNCTRCFVTIYLRVTDMSNSCWEGGSPTIQCQWFDVNGRDYRQWCQWSC